MSRMKEALLNLTSNGMAQHAAQRISDNELYVNVANEIVTWAWVNSATREEAVAIAFNSQFFNNHVVARLLTEMVADEYNARLGEEEREQLPKKWVVYSIEGQDEYNNVTDFARRVVEQTAKGFQVRTVILVDTDR